MHNGFSVFGGVSGLSKKSNFQFKKEKKKLIAYILCSGQYVL